MADKDFFKQDEPAEETKTEDAEESESEEVQKIKVGENEYTQEELDKIVKVGQIGLEAEEKYNRPIDKFWPDYTKANQENKELKEELDTLKKSQVEKKVEEGQELSPEEMTARVKEEARKHGLLTQEQFDEAYMAKREGEKILENTTKVVEDAKKEEKPETDVESLLTYMKDEGIKNPQTAYKLMKETELDEWKMSKLNESKPAGLVTQEGSTAGAKQPEQKVPQTEDELKAALKAHLEG